MKRIIRILLAALSISAVSCVKDLEPVPSGIEMTITAGLESNGGGTKTSTDDDGLVTWQADDAISVWAGGKNCQFSITAGTGTNNAAFTGTVPEGEIKDAYGYLYGIYPYSEGNFVLDGKIHASIPSAQTATAGSYDPKAFVTVARNPQAEGFYFSNVCSGVRFKVRNSGVRNVVLRARSGEALAGDLTIEFGEDGKPVVTNIQNPQSEIILTAGSNTFETDVWYYITTVPVLMNTGLELVFSTEDEYAIVRKSKAIELPRSIFGQMSAGDEGATYRMASADWNASSNSYPGWASEKTIDSKSLNGTITYILSDLVDRSLASADINEDNPRISYPWEGDCWVFENNQAVSAGEDRAIKFECRISAAGPRYWILEFLDGTEWVPASGLELESCKLPDGRVIGYNVDLSPGGSADSYNKTIISLLNYKKPTTKTQARLRCLAAIRANNGTMMANPIGCSTRLDCSEGGQEPYLGLPSAADYIEPQSLTIVSPLVGSWNKSTLVGVNFMKDGVTTMQEPIAFRVESIDKAAGKAVISANAGARGCDGVIVSYPYSPDTRIDNTSNIFPKLFGEMYFGYSAFSGSSTEVKLEPFFSTMDISFDMTGTLAGYAEEEVKSVDVSFFDSSDRPWPVSGSCNISMAGRKSITLGEDGLSSISIDFPAGTRLSEASIKRAIPFRTGIRLVVEVTTWNGTKFTFNRSRISFNNGSSTVLCLDMEDGDTAETVYVFRPKASSTVYGQITDQNGDPMAGVLVSDGIEIVETNSEGWYEIASKKAWDYVYMIIPSGYAVPANGAFPQFFKKFNAGSLEQERIDMQLVYEGDQTRHRMSFLGDMHLAGGKCNDTYQFTQCIDDYLDNFVNSSESAGIPVYGQTLGDMTWDVYWISKSYYYPQYISALNGLMGTERAKIYHCIGNHDHEWHGPYGYPAGDFDCEQSYRDYLGPNYYSYNIGQVHYVVLDDIECTNPGVEQSSTGRTYNERVTQGQLDWLKKDMSHVSMSTPVVISAHAPFYNNSGSLRSIASQGLISILNGRRTYLVTGHTHCQYNVDDLAANNIFELNSGSLCATWWWVGYKYSNLYLARDGSLAGYRVLDVDGTDIKWYYKTVGHDKSAQFRTYDRNCIDLSSYDDGDNDFKARSSRWSGQSDENLVYIELWDYDPAWTIEVVEDGYAEPLPWTKCSDYDPLHLISFMAPSRLSNTKSFWTNPNPNLFEVQAHSPESTLHIKVTDRFGRVYTKEMARPEAFPNTRAEINSYVAGYKWK